MEVPNVGIVQIDAPQRRQTARQAFGLELNVAGDWVDPRLPQVASDRRADDMPNSAPSEKAQVAHGTDDVPIGDIDERL